MAKHLSLSERAFIERALVHEKSFADPVYTLGFSIMPHEPWSIPLQLILSTALAQPGLLFIVKL